MIAASAIASLPRINTGSAIRFPSTRFGEAPNFDGGVRTYYGAEHACRAAFGTDTNRVMVTLFVEVLRQLQDGFGTGLHAETAALAAFRIDIRFSSGQYDTPYSGKFEKILVFDKMDRKTTGKVAKNLSVELSPKAG